MQKQLVKCPLVDETVTLEITSVNPSGIGSAHIASQIEVTCSLDCICDFDGWPGCKAKELKAKLE